MPEYLEVAARSSFILLSLFFITKLLGKKQLSKLSFFEYITGITVGSIAGTLSMDLGLPLSEGLMSILLWFSFPLVFSFISLKSSKFRRFAEGKPSVFIKDGQIDEKALRKEKYSVDELLEQLRKKDVFRAADVEFATLDTNGDLSVMLKKEKQPLVKEDILSLFKRATPPQAVIIDGEIDEAALKAVGFDKPWLLKELLKRKLDFEAVFLAQADSEGNLTLDLYNWTNTQQN
ncbi:hypothetical protein AS034_08990 [[Bacillus] enclensis]|uniref:Uncharacterized membrane protein YcaP, DUF421 family n=1 Tax=[Bacillus] enclensis TaxID=1402860 RepID=A0A0V8HJC4_9BACI|nr:DUF421 domain-containing protein [[Bacillus] enclensis]KSU62256.1 hypothetical protein AS034_08990 [[Bacillus] enclensis]OAT83203.1 hypothetical protein A6P54_06320 [Bacillus sp. MKU004]SCC01549.1 Uncharacterized membrane protein YcaP, DUF421 family [[Bacillus] enclensis]